jgi:purine-binding chemotaxis protein CheW
MTDLSESTSPKLRELISFRIGTQEFCVDITSVREIRGWTETTPVPLAPDYVRGVINLRGTVMPVVDMSLRLGRERTDPTERHVIVVTYIGNQLVGLLVDAVCETLTLKDSDIQAAPDVGADAVRALIRGIIDVDGHMVTFLALDYVLPHIDTPSEAA